MDLRKYLKENTTVCLMYALLWYTVGSNGCSPQGRLNGKENCPVGQWKCRDGLQCIEEVFVCDGLKKSEGIDAVTSWMLAYDSCDDKSDEDPAMCTQWNCTAGRWKCWDGLQCIDENHVCDGSDYRSCNDESDEDPATCTQWNCASGQWKCNDGLECIPEISVCNGRRSCKDNSDEDPAMCVQWDCGVGYWKCKDGVECIPAWHVCDGLWNITCKDGSDEDPATCTQWECHSGYTKCSDNLQCVQEHSICDREVNCIDGSDELCTDSCLNTPLLSGEKYIIRRCYGDLRACIPVHQYCDGIAQCPDGGDETLSHCTCEDWGLKSCKAEDHQQIRCMNTHWVTVHKSEYECHDFLYNKNNFIKQMENYSDKCIMVSEDGIDEPNCLNNPTNTPCRTLSYPINQGFPSVCMYGTFSNLTENIELAHSNNKTSGFNIICKGCLSKSHTINLSCTTVKICTISFHDFEMDGVIIILNNVNVTLRNVILDESVIENLAYLSENTYNEIYVENSTLSCYGNTKCGLHLANLTAAKVVFVGCHLYNFRLDISVRQLMLIFYDTFVNMPSINVKVKSFEYLKIPALILFDKVTMVRNQTIPKKSDILMKNTSEAIDDLIYFELTNPDVVITESHFVGVRMEIQSRRQYFKPMFFVLVLERNSFLNGFHVGNGGGLKISSEVQNSEVMVVDCIFSNNSAFKEMGNIHGRGGGLYVEARSLKLLMAQCTFLHNKASDSGLALYTTQGVDVSFRNCTFQYIIDPDAPIQQSLLYVNGKVIEFLGIFHIFNPKPESYVGPIDVFYIGQAENNSIETFCPRWYNHIMEYTSASIDVLAIPDVKYKCNPCIDNFYTSRAENNTLYYNGDESIIRLKEVQGMGSCLQCPYGAICTGNNVMPRPNYWGYWHKGELVFQQCPAGYCCPGIEESVCNIYMYCPGNRTGTLCGACQEGFSVSILTGSCTPDSQCGKQGWFWLVVVLASMAYALWYSFKDDIFALFFYSIRSVKRCARNQIQKIMMFQLN